MKEIYKIVKATPFKESEIDFGYVVLKEFEITKEQYEHVIKELEAK